MLEHSSPSMLPKLTVVCPLRKNFPLVTALSAIFPLVTAQLAIFPVVTA